MTTDKPEPPNPSPPRRTMSPAIREFLKHPCFQEAKLPGGAYIITGIRPPAPQAAEPTNPPTESSHEKQ